MTADGLLGPLPADWEYTTLGEACVSGGGDIQTGPFGSQLHASDYVQEGVPSIMPRNIGDNRVLEGGIARITTKDAKRLSRYLVKEGDIVYSRRGDVTRRALVREYEDGWLCGTGCLRVRLGDASVDPCFTSYFLGHPSVREWIIRHAHGATMPNLNTSILAACPFVIPPLSEQRAIAHVLGTLDDKIELNRRMNETLEAMARAVFKDWFVDFGPVRAKLEGRELYLPPDVWSLFPDRLVDSELGEIPEGWEVGTLGDVIEVARGLSYKGSGLSPDGSPMHNLNSIYEGGGYKRDGIKHYTGEHKPRHLARAGDVIVANTEQGHDRLLIGHAAVVPHTTRDGGLFSHHLYRIRPKDIDYLSSEFICELLNTQTMHEVVSGYATGTTVNMLPLDALQLPPTVLPTTATAQIFSTVAQEMRMRREHLVEESEIFASLRDTLLPKLVSGELRIGAL